MTSTDRELEAFAELLRSAEVWESPPSTTTPALSRWIADFADFAQTLQVNDRVALREVIRLLAADEESSIAEREDLLTASVVHGLVEISRRSLFTFPERAHRIALLATVVVKKLTPKDRTEAYVIRMREGDAWKEVANALRQIGRYPEALEAVDNAREVYDSLIASEWSIARLQLTLAGIYQEMERPQEALPVLALAAETFRQHGDDKSLVHCRLLEGAAYYMAEDPAAALLIWTDLMRQDVDNTTKAMLANNIGYACSETRQFDQATTYLQQAADLFDILGNPTEAAKSARGLARVHLATGRVSTALKQLVEVERTMTRLGMTTAAALTGLDIVDCWLALGEQDEIEKKCSEMLSVFASAGMNVSSRVAIAYLRDAARVESVSIDDVEYVRDFLKQAADNPQQHFAPPEAN